MISKYLKILIISLFTLYLLFPATGVYPQNSDPGRESKILNDIETIIATRDSTKSTYLRELVRNDGSPAVRSRAIGALMYLRDEGSNALYIEKLTRDPSPRVRVAAAYAMCEVKSLLLISPLLNALKNDEDHIVRAISARAIGNQGRKDAGKILIHFLLNDPSYQVRIESAAALGKLGIEEAIDPLKISTTKERDRLVRIGSINALISFGEMVGADFFIKEFEGTTDPDIRFELYKAIVGQPNMGGYLEVGLSDGDERIRFVALKSITEQTGMMRRGSNSVNRVSFLKKMLSDPYKGIRDLANDTLNRMGYKTKDLGVRYEIVR